MDWMSLKKNFDRLHIVDRKNLKKEGQVLASLGKTFSLLGEKWVSINGDFLKRK